MHRVNSVDELAHILKVNLSSYDTEVRTGHSGIQLALVRKVAQAIKQGNRSAVMIGYSLLMQDPHLPFGKILKSNLARALKHDIELLTEHEKLNLAGQTAKLLSLPFCPREVEDYCRLVKKMGHPIADNVIATSRPLNEKAQSLLAYLGMPEPKEN